MNKEKKEIICLKKPSKCKTFCQKFPEQKKKNKKQKEKKRKQLVYTECIENF